MNNFIEIENNNKMTERFNNLKTNYSIQYLSMNNKLDDKIKEIKDKKEKNA
jgi:hypothetical protein